MKDLFENASHSPQKKKNTFEGNCLVISFFFIKVKHSCAAFFKIVLFIYLLFLAVLSLRCCVGFFLVVASGGCSAVAVASVVEHGLWGMPGQHVWHMDSVALLYMGSSQTRGQTHVSCIGRWILHHWATREVLVLVLKRYIHMYVYLHTHTHTHLYIKEPG